MFEFQYRAFTSFTMRVISNFKRFRSLCMHDENCKSSELTFKLVFAAFFKQRSLIERNLFLFISVQKYHRKRYKRNVYKKYKENTFHLGNVGSLMVKIRLSTCNLEKKCKKKQYCHCLQVNNQKNNS